MCPKKGLTFFRSSKMHNPVKEGFCKIIAIFTKTIVTFGQTDDELINVTILKHIKYNTNLIASTKQ